MWKKTDLFQGLFPHSRELFRSNSSFTLFSFRLTWNKSYRVLCLIDQLPCLSQHTELAEQSLMGVWRCWNERKEMPFLWILYMFSSLRDDGKLWLKSCENSTFYFTFLWAENADRRNVITLWIKENKNLILVISPCS